MSNHGKSPQHISNLTTSWTNVTGPGGKKKKKKKKSKNITPSGTTSQSYGSSPVYVGANAPTNFLPEAVISTSKPTEIEIVEEDVVISSPNKMLSRVSVDRGGKRALFSNATGRIADDLQANIPENQPKRKKKTAESVLKDWTMFHSSNEDKIT